MPRGEITGRKPSVSADPVNQSGPPTPNEIAPTPHAEPKSAKRAVPAAYTWAACRADGLLDPAVLSGAFHQRGHLLPSAAGGPRPGDDESWRPNPDQR